MENNNSRNASQTSSKNVTTRNAQDSTRNAQDTTKNAQDTRNTTSNATTSNDFRNNKNR